MVVVVGEGVYRKNIHARQNSVGKNTGREEQMFMQDEGDFCLFRKKIQKKEIVQRGPPRKKIPAQLMGRKKKVMQVMQSALPTETQ